MSLTLILMRHAKSSWDNPLNLDHDRPLNKRGRSAARALGQWLENKGLLPDEVLSSTAVRTHETWTRLGLTAPEVRFERSLYHAPAERMIPLLHRATGKTVLMLGHYPGIADLAHRLATAPVRHTRFHDYPTCATTVLTFSDTRWEHVRFKTGTISEFVTPSDLLETVDA